MGKTRIEELGRVTPAESWVSRRVSLTAGIVHQLSPLTPSNVIGIRVNHETGHVLASTEPGVNSVNFEVRAEPLNYGFLTRFTPISSFFLVASVNLDVTIMEIFTREPLQALQTLINRQTVIIPESVNTPGGQIITGPGIFTLNGGVSQLVRQLDLLAHHANAADVHFGNTNLRPLILRPGQSWYTNILSNLNTYSVDVPSGNNVRVFWLRTV